MTGQADWPFSLSRHVLGTARGERQNAAPELKNKYVGPNQACSQTTQIGAVKILGGNLLVPVSILN